MSVKTRVLSTKVFLKSTQILLKQEDATRWEKYEIEADSRDFSMLTCICTDNSLIDHGSPSRKWLSAHEQALVLWKLKVPHYSVEAFQYQ
ncbi:hypothetical protein BDB01DRAFT_854354 [Pilobolus umbonatus]|nr:hypothetical protein BDB01DRAFT_854354 [Pilobolus umbonatus]